MENGNYYSILGYTWGIDWDNGKENGNTYSIILLCRGYLGVILFIIISSAENRDAGVILKV